MNAAQQKEYWHKFSRFQQRYELIYTPRFNTVLKEQIQQYISHGTLMAIHSAPIYKQLLSLYTTVSPIYAASATVQIRSMKARAPIGFNERIVELMKRYYGIDLLNTANGITQTTKDVIQRVLTEASVQGWSFSEIVKRLQSPDLTAARARLIARTETVSAANAASNIAARDTGLVMDKIWIAAKDNRVRPDHALVDGTTIPMDQKFIVGGMPMSFPGDVNGGAKEVCNCRCTHAFIPKRDVNGRLIRV